MFIIIGLFISSRIDTAYWGLSAAAPYSFQKEAGHDGRETEIYQDLEKEAGRQAQVIAQVRGE